MMAVTAPPGEAQGLARILAATDLSSRADRALRRAAMLAAARAAELAILHAVDDDLPPALAAATRREATTLLRDQIAALPEPLPAAMTGLVEEGDPFEAILRVAEARAADLVVLGEHRRRPLRDIFEGTTLERVMRHGRRPVLMVTRPPAGPYRHVLAATDLSPHAAHALRTAQRLGLLEGARVTLLHAFTPPGLGSLALADAPAASFAARSAEATRAAAAALDGFAASLDLSATTDRRVAEGEAAAVIKDSVAALRPDLLVVGTAGAGFLRRAVLGSVATAVLGAATCDALAVPPAVAD